MPKVGVEYCLPLPRFEKSHLNTPKSEVVTNPLKKMDHQGGMKSGPIIEKEMKAFDPYAKKNEVRNIFQHNNFQNKRKNIVL